MEPFGDFDPCFDMSGETMKHIIARVILAQQSILKASGCPYFMHCSPYFEMEELIECHSVEKLRRIVEQQRGENLFAARHHRVSDKSVAARSHRVAFRLQHGPISD